MSQIVPDRSAPVATALSIGLSVDGQTVFALAETRRHGRRAALLPPQTLQRLLDHAGNVLRGLGDPAADSPAQADLLPAEAVHLAAGGGTGRFAQFADWEDAPTVRVEEVTLEPSGGYLVLAFAGTPQTVAGVPERTDVPAFSVTLDRDTAYRVLGMMGARARSAGLVTETAAAWLFRMEPAASTWVH
jgi:hypothetical protein